MKPSHDGGVVKGPHVYVKRADGSSGYEPVLKAVIEGYAEHVAAQLAPSEAVITSYANVDITDIIAPATPLPTSADLDAVAAEQTAKEATSGKVRLIKGK